MNRETAFVATFLILGALGLARCDPTSSFSFHPQRESATHPPSDRNCVTADGGAMGAEVRP